MGEIIVKHYRRPHAAASEKELVTEIVVENSATGQFLKRMHESRLTRPCFQTIDMRGRVAGECRRYVFNDRVHYLDEISFQMFEQGLRENRGVYTVGTFESIIGGPHTLRALQDVEEAEQHRREEADRRRLERARAAARERARADNAERAADDIEIGTLYNPDLLPLGYFRKRTHPRLQYACAVTLEHGNIKSSALTRDISVCGVQVRIKGASPFRAGQEVLVSFTGLKDQTSRVSISRIAYKVVAADIRQGDAVLRLRRVNLDRPAGFSELIEDLVERYERRYKIDIEDEYQSVLSWCYERIYTESATQIPFFVEQDDGGVLRVQSVAMTEGNRHIARFFCTDADSYNFTPLCIPDRLQALHDGRAVIVAMYRGRGEQDRCMRIHSAADCDHESERDFVRFVRHALAQPEHCVVKLHAGPVPALSVPEAKVEEVSQRLQHKSESQMVELRDRLARLRYVGYLVDVTPYYRQLVADGDSAGGDTGNLTAWVGSERRAVTDGSVKDRLQQDIGNWRPELVRFGYVERRREDRYLAETQVEIKIGGKLYQGMTQDISTRGMRIRLEQTLDIEQRSVVKVGLVSLQRKRSSTNLMDIPYRVVNSVSDGGTVLMLERILGGDQKGLGKFFVELITKNQHKLGVDVGDIRGATASRIYESLLAANTPSIPFFLARDEEGGACLQYIGMPEAGNRLSEFFLIDGEHDFHCLSESRLVTALYDAVQILARQYKPGDDRPAPFELDMFLYKEVDEDSGDTFIHAATELDFSTAAGREAFIHKVMACPDWRFVRLIATFAQPLNAKAFEKMVQTVRAQSKHRAIKLSEITGAVVGCGELLDLTDEMLLLRKLG